MNSVCYRNEQCSSFNIEISFALWASILNLWHAPGMYKFLKKHFILHDTRFLQHLTMFLE